MGGKHKIDVTDTFVPYDHLTSKTKQLKALGESLGRDDTTSTLKVLEAKTTLEKITEGTTVRHRYQPRAVRASSVRRPLNWLMSRFGQSDLR